MDRKNDIAVCIPCYNEEATIWKVIDDFSKVLPEAVIYVYDNNSKDSTKEIAMSSGKAIVRDASIQGKGYVVSKMFSEIDADIYVLVDGDDTYPAEMVRELIEPVARGKADMVCGDRLSNGTYGNENKRLFHGFGNSLVRNVINILFNVRLKDIMTGYRVFSKRFVENFPILSMGFEIETEMTLHALDNGYIIREIEIDYKDRPEGSESKLNTFSDGIKVLCTIFSIYKDYRPLSFFGGISIIFFIFGILSGMPVLLDYAIYRYVYHVPMAILAVAIVMFSINILTCGIILQTIAKNNKRNYKLHLLKRKT